MCALLIAGWAIRAISPRGLLRCTLIFARDDAAAGGITDGEMVSLASVSGCYEFANEIVVMMTPSVVPIRHGLNSCSSGKCLVKAARRSRASINDLINRRRMDPLLGNAARFGAPMAAERTSRAVAAE